MSFTSLSSCWDKTVHTIVVPECPGTHCSITTTSAFRGIKPQHFHCTQRSCGPGVWTCALAMAYLGFTRSGVSAWTSQLLGGWLKGPGTGIIPRLLYWRAGQVTQRLSSGESADLSSYPRRFHVFGLPQSMQPEKRWTSYIKSLYPRNKCSTKQVPRHMTFWLSLENLTEWLLSYFLGQNNYKLTQI